MPVGAQSAASDDAVHMNVRTEVLSPGVQHHGDAELTTEPARTVAELEQGLGSGLEEQTVDEGGMALCEGVELVGQGEHEVEVADIEQVGAVALDPAGLLERLALGAMTVAARGVLDGHRRTVVALHLESPEGGGAAVDERTQDTVLLSR